MIAYNFTVWHTWLSGFCRESCASLRPSSDSSNCRQHQAPCLHCCCTLASCWTRASSTHMSLWSCAALHWSKATNNWWRSGWEHTRFVAGAGGIVSRWGWDILLFTLQKSAQQNCRQFIAVLFDWKMVGLHMVEELGSLCRYLRMSLICGHPQGESEIGQCLLTVKWWEWVG